MLFSISVLIFSAVICFSGCTNDPIFATIENEVELKDPSITGNIYALVEYNGDLYAADGYLYRRNAGAGSWKKVKMPSGVTRCAGLAVDGAGLYGLFQNEDWSFHSVQKYSAGTWDMVTGLPSISSGIDVALGSGGTVIFAATYNQTSRKTSVYKTTGAGALTFDSTEVITNAPIWKGSAGDYFATSNGIYDITGNVIVGGPTSGIRGIALDEGGNHLYAVTSGNAYHYNIVTDTWDSPYNFNADYSAGGGLSILKAGTKNILLIALTRGYWEVHLDDTTGACVSRNAPGANSNSSVKTGSEAQYDSSVGNYMVNRIYAVTSPVPAGNNYIVYAGISHRKYNGLWAYYSDTQTEWNRE
ncbi:hypothetical protein K7I13_04810 [Brucepastera parasyntrophica]|uniref:hypothetical protein n=1 Tax=Brucepastera parasyntrophica TaxID=2880008 RepID=UPI00210D2E2C|nr:hypothetical protein [Brucepastera parasyntrophica]ULQ60605.1 hypothetical protein K7I13_04810 [Brucepastera parasyntrophica]